MQARKRPARVRSRHSSLIFKTFFHIFLIKQLIQIQNRLHKSNIIQPSRLQGLPPSPHTHQSDAIWEARMVCGGVPPSPSHECFRFYESFIGFHSPLRGNPLNVSTIISLITLSALGHSLDLTKIRNWKLLSQYQAINLCHPAVNAAQGNNVVSWPTQSSVVVLFRMSAFIGTGFCHTQDTLQELLVLYLDYSDTLQIEAVGFRLCLLLLFRSYSGVEGSGKIKMSPPPPPPNEQMRWALPSHITPHHLLYLLMNNTLCFRRWTALHRTVLNS